MNDQQRSTRRVLEPTPSSGDADANDLVEPITENLDPQVAGDQVVNGKARSFSSSNEAQARSNPPESIAVEEDAVEEFDIDRLEQEMDVAIAAELGEDAPSPEVAETGAEEEPTPDDEEHPVGEDVPEGNREGVEPCADEHPTETVEATSEPTVRSTLAARLLAPISAPVEGLSPGGRRLLEIVALTLALWVPVVWVAAMSGGFGLGGG